ncbi:MAG: hypothetical protein PHC88_00525 [Terrimicrobiaceae bacterium]|nr:hypothetical protein [Terrimicrobiaceae bacterium]
MNPTRFRILLGVAVVLFGILAWHWISGWGLVTVHADEQPLAKIIRSIERQGGIQIVTNADLAAPVSMDVDRVPVAEAVDVLTARLDGDWSVGYVAGPAKTDVAAGLAALKEGKRDENFVRFGFGGGFGGGMGGGDSVVDIRRVSWKVSPSDDQQLQSYLDQFAQKTGAMAMAPEAWNPTLAKTPDGGRAAAAIRGLVRSANGQVQEVFLIRVRDDEGDRTADAGRDRSGRADGGFGGGRGNFHPEWMEERAQARIEQLPAEDRAQAKKDFDDMRATWQKIRSLPEAERRAAMEKLFNDPAVQERMMERQMSRDAKRSPEKRAERFRQYIQRKQQIKASS